MQPLKDVAVCLQGDFVCNDHLKQSSWLIRGLAQHLMKRQALPPAVREDARRGNVFVEARGYGVHSLAWDLGRHLLLRQLPGKILVLADKPSPAISTVRKQWLRNMHRVTRERAATLKPELIRDIQYMQGYLERLHMSIKLPHRSYDNEVSFVPPDTARSIPPNCHTLYVTTPMDDTAFDALVAKMPDHGLVVRYVSEEQPATYLRLHTRWEIH
jgi:hypothetical protein